MPSKRIVFSRKSKVFVPPRHYKMYVEAENNLTYIEDFAYKESHKDGESYRFTSFGLSTGKGQKHQLIIAHLADGRVCTIRNTMPLWWKQPSGEEINALVAEYGSRSSGRQVLAARGSLSHRHISPPPATKPASFAA